MDCRNCQMGLSPLRSLCWLSALVVLLLLSGCQREDSSQASTAPAESPAEQPQADSGVAAPAMDVITLQGRLLVAHVVDGRSVIVYTMNPQHIADIAKIGGLVSIEGVTSEPIAFRRSTKWNALEADAGTTIATPAKARLKLFVGFSDAQTFDVTLIERAAPFLQKDAQEKPVGTPEITTAGLGLVVDNEKATFGVIGNNLEYGHLFFVNKSTEIEMPVDAARTTHVVVLEPAMLSLLPDGEWKVVVRTPSGQASLEHPIQIKK